MQDILSFIPAHEGSMDYIRPLYESSFPVEERRPWQGVLNKLNHESCYEMWLLRCGDTNVGMAVTWQLSSALYVEYLAIDNDMRCKGLGKRALVAIKSHAGGKRVVLEAEPPSTGEMACRRLGFYSRNGFEALPGVDYVQPPYAPGLPSVKLLLLADGPVDDTDTLIKEIHHKVYGYDNV